MRRIETSLKARGNLAGAANDNTVIVLAGVLYTEPSTLGRERLLTVVNLATGTSNGYAIHHNSTYVTYTK